LVWRNCTYSTSTKVGSSPIPKTNLVLDFLFLHFSLSCRKLWFVEKIGVQMETVETTPSGEELENFVGEIAEAVLR
jgi:hypothetical protein